MNNEKNNQADRSGEQKRSVFRSDRIVFINEYWYFMTRERPPEGPFQTRDDASNAVERYLSIIKSPMFDAGNIARINTVTV